MILLKSVVLCVIVAVSWCSEDHSFPPGFKFGAATSAYQVEGAWNVSDKGESIWDRFVHEHPEMILNASTGDVACDSYHQWRRDVEIAAELKLDYYRFSISWPRLLPSGFANHISEDGKKFYSDLIDGLLSRGIQPVVTLYHWDLPQNLQDLGGWTNPLIADWFADYARVAFSLYADRVKTWITLNEPLIFCDLTYCSGLFAPGVIDTDIAPYLCNKNALMAHAKAWRIYDQEFRGKFHGQVSFCNHLIWLQAATPEDEPLAELAREYLVGRYSHPVFSKDGGWPPLVENFFAEKSKREGYPRSRVPAFTQLEIEFIRGTYDFYGFNMYTSRLVRKPLPGEQLRPWPMGDAVELNAVLDFDPKWKPTTAWWFRQYPEGMRKQLGWIKQRYGNFSFLITENGVGSGPGSDDEGRVQFYKDYLRQVLLAIKDGVNVTAYTAWTLIDNFEWGDGYSTKFGLYEVNFTDPMRTRTPRKSAHFYKRIISAHSLDVPDVDISTL